jgi:hypothetical protein
MATMISPLATAIPEHSNDGYVAAAYIVFFAILLIYVAIMAIRLGHVERDLRDLQTRTDRPPQDQAHGQRAMRSDETRPDTTGRGATRQDETRGETHDETREHEPV